MYPCPALDLLLTLQQIFSLLHSQYPFPRPPARAHQRQSKSYPCPCTNFFWIRPLQKYDQIIPGNDDTSAFDSSPATFTKINTAPAVMGPNVENIHFARQFVFFEYKRMYSGEEVSKYTPSPKKGQVVIDMSDGNKTKTFLPTNVSPPKFRKKNTVPAQPPPSLYRPQYHSPPRLPTETFNFAIILKNCQIWI